MLLGHLFVKDIEQIGRLAMRKEGSNWVAYYAVQETMDGAVFLGSIRLYTVMSHPERKVDFRNMMRDLVADIIEEKLGVRPEWGGAKPAPEHERAGTG